MSWDVISPPSDPNTAETDQVKIEYRSCPSTSDDHNCTDSSWHLEGVYPSSVNSTELRLFPNLFYKFQASSNNSLIGCGESVITREYIESDVRGKTIEIEISLKC